MHNFAWLCFVKARKRFTTSRLFCTNLLYRQKNYIIYSFFSYIILLFSRRFDFTKLYRKDQWKWRQIVNSINSSNRYDEYKDYDFRRGGWQGGTGHFTQVVWKDSKELGMGRAKTGDGRLTFVVGRYRPAGNVINFMQDNVFPRRGR